MDQNSKKENASVVRGRRALIKGAAGALPAILTLQSGAALARSSNMISTSSPEEAKDSYGRTLCMDGRSVSPAQGEGGQVYDMGEPPYARVTAIADREYYWHSEQDGFGKIDESEMCEKGGTYYYKRRWGMGQVNVRKGMLVSATALSSFAGKVDIIDI